MGLATSRADSASLSRNETGWAMMAERARQVERDEAPGEGRALVALAAPAAAIPPRCHRQAAFLAHLIATQQQFPQTRARRRAEPDQAVTAYRTAAELARWG